MEIDLINGTFRHHEPGMFGIKRHISEIHARLPDVSLNLIEYDNRRFGFGSRLDRLLNDYAYHPLCVRRRLRPGRICAIVAQHFLYLLTTLRPHPCVVFCHDLIRLSRAQDYPSRLNSLLTRHSFGNLTRADRIVTLSEYVRGQILSIFHLSPEQVVVVPCAVDQGLFRPDSERRGEMRRRWGVAESPVLLYVGSEEPRKNLDFLLRTVAEVRRRLPDVRLVKIGQPQYPGGRERFLRSAEAMGVADILRVIDFLPDGSDGLPAAYNAADVLIFPSLDEGFGLPPLEAMASGTPVVASDAASIPEVVGTGGILLPPRSPADFADAVYRLITEGSFREATVQRGLAQAARFTWEESARRTYRVYRELADRI